MSNKDNLPVKYEKAGKPKVKEQVTQWVEQIEVFDGFSFNLWNPVKAVVFAVAAFFGFAVIVELLLPDTSLVWILLTPVGFFGMTMLVWSHWEQRYDAGVVSYALNVLCSCAMASAGLLLPMSFVVGLAGLDVPDGLFPVYITLVLVYFAGLYLLDSLETQTEERVVAEEGGDRL